MQRAKVWEKIGWTVGISLGLIMVGLVSISITGCSPEEEPAIEVVETSELPEEETTAPPPPALDPETLRPVISELAAKGVGPSKVMIEFARPVIPRNAVNKPPGEKTVLRIEPDLPGELRFSSPTTLLFTPTYGFQPQTRYEVELVSLETERGVLEAPTEKRWLHVFETPGFDFVRLSLGRIDYPNRKAQLNVVFSGAVEASEVAERARVYVRTAKSGTQRPNFRIEAGPTPNVVVAFLDSREITPGAHLKLELDEGVPSRLAPEFSSRKTKAELQLSRGPEIKIHKAYHDEGTNGFFIQVLCDDGAVETKRHFWDRAVRSSYRLSTRCLLDEEEAQAGIRFEPEIDFTVSSSRGGFRVFAPFKRGTYRMNLEAGLRSVDGGMVYRAHEAEFNIPARSPSLQFVSKGRYLPRSSWNSLPIRHMNLEEAKLTIRHVPSENLVFWMSDEYTETADQRTSNLILERKIKLSGPEDAQVTTHFDVSQMVPADTKGLLEIHLQNGGANDTVRILLTDLHLIAKRAGKIKDDPASEEILAWALDIESNQPESGVEIELVRASGFALSRCRTDASGGCRLRLPRDDIDPSPPFALLANKQKDLTYLKFDELKAEVREEQVAGEPYGGEKTYRAALYSDRGVYRPGETAHLAAIVRQQNHLAPPEGLPVQAQLLDPQGQVIRSSNLETNPAGYLDLDLEFPAFASTGRYEVKVKVAGKDAGNYRFQVEEFVPERMRVNVDAAEEHFLLGEAMELDISSRYLFGGVPSGNRVELSCEIHPGNFAPAENNSFHYGVWRDENAPERPLTLGTLTGQLDGEGQGRLACPGEGRGGGFRGPAQLIARAAVFEAGSGRTTVGTTTRPVHPENFYIGLSSSSESVSVGNDLEVQGVVVDWRGRRIDEPNEVTVEFIRLSTEYGWFYDERLGRDNYRLFNRPVVEAKEKVQVQDGKFRVTWKPEVGGWSFLVRASAGRARTDLELEGGGGWYYWSPRESQTNQTPRPGRASWIALETPENVKVGERFPVRFNAPYQGRILLTAETDRVITHRWLDVDAGESVWFVELEDFAPNVYVTAFLVKDPKLEGAFLPDRAFGVRSVTVEPTEFTQPLTLTAPLEVRSNSELKVKLALGPTEGPTYATVAAVDEGILSLTRFQSPNPFSSIFERRALGVETFETVGWTLVVPPGGSAAEGAGDTAGELGRVQPVKPVALWSGMVEVPESGEVEVSFDLPQYRGELRVMAVTADTKRMGRADVSVTVRDPLIVQATLPRFMVHQDEIEIPVFVTNLSGQQQEVDVNLESENLSFAGLDSALDEEPAITLLGDTRNRLSLADGEGGTVIFRARASQPTGAAKLRVIAKAEGFESREELDLPLLPVGPKSRQVQRIELTEGERDLTPFLEGWMPLSEKSTFWVTSNPYADAFDHLRFLVRYPYGCLEQTTSSTRPLLYLGSLIENIDPELLREHPIDEMVQAGIDRLFSMQTPAGGFAYWMGGSRPAYWATAYATHLLLDARDLGYTVPETRLNEVLKWIEREIRNHYTPGRADRYSENGEPYLHFVLARAGKGQKARIAKRIEEIGEPRTNQQKESLYLLKAALYLSGDQRYERELRQPDLSDVGNARRNNWSFYSDRRMRGLILATYVDLFGNNEEATPIANLVAEGLRGNRSSWYTTQELVWGITGLGKFLEASPADFKPPILRASGRQLKPQEPRKVGKSTSKDRIWNLYRASEYDQITLNVPRKSEGDLYLILSSEGVRTEPDWKTGGEGLRVERRYLNASGQVIDLQDGKHTLGDLVYVDLQIRNTSPDRISNIALVDRIPAGWEIENPRLGRAGAEAGLTWLDTSQLWQADHLDLRDDRIEVFGHLNKRESKRVVYAVRAVTAGTFTIPPVEAEAMYDPTQWARQPQQKIRIRGPWREEPGNEPSKTAAIAPNGTAKTRDGQLASAE